MTYQGWDLQLTAYSGRDWRANFFPVGIAHSIAGVGADAVGRGAAGGRGGSERLRDRRDRWLGSDRWPRVVRVDDAD